VLCAAAARTLRWSHHGGGARRQPRHFCRQRSLVSERWRRLPWSGSAVSPTVPAGRSL